MAKKKRSAKKAARKPRPKRPAKKKSKRKSPKQTESKSKRLRAKRPASPPATPSHVVAFRERRHHPRLPICARVRWGDQTDPKVVKTVERYFFTRDLSRSGLFLLTDHPPPLGEMVSVDLAVQYLKESVHLRGKVVRHESDEGRAIGCGVKFMDQDPEFNRVMQWIGHLLDHPPQSV